MSKAVPKEPPNEVHQNSILCETIHKETRLQQLYLDYSINPFRKMHTLTPKPNSMGDSEEGMEDTQFIKVIERANQEPVKKYIYPQTESQEIGWISKPLVELDRSDTRLCFPKQSSAITKYMDAAWKA